MTFTNFLVGLVAIGAIVGIYLYGRKHGKKGTTGTPGGGGGGPSQS